MGASFFVGSGAFGSCGWNLALRALGIYGLGCAFWRSQLFGCSGLVGSGLLFSGFRFGLEFASY